MTLHSACGVPCYGTKEKLSVFKVTVRRSKKKDLCSIAVFRLWSVLSPLLLE